MKRLKFLSYLMAALVMFTTVSCDDDDDDDINPDREALLTASLWTGDKLYMGNADVTEQYASFFNVKNATIRFNNDGTYILDLYGDGNVREGDWELLGNQIVIDKDTDDELTIEVNKLTATELWAEGDFVDIGQAVEVRFVH